MKKQFILPLLALAFLTACSSDQEEVTPANDTQVAPRMMTVEVTENPMVDEHGVRKQAATRGSEITTSSLASFSMNYQNNKYDFSKTGETWNEDNNWPAGVESSTKIDFYAYNGGTFYYNNGSPYVSFTVDNTPASQKDLLVATHKQIAYSDNGGKVTLAFDHACAAVNFNICKTAGVGDKAVVIKSVVLSNVKNTGNYYYGSDWSGASGSVSYTLTDSDITLTTEYQALPCGYLFLIPQSKEGVTLTVNYTVDGDTQQTHDFNLTGTWSTGIEHTINIQMGTSIIKDQL